MYLKIAKLHEDAITPRYASEGDAGLDLHAIETTVIPAGEHRVIKTGIAIQLAENTVAKVCSRSGLAAKHGVFVLNAPGIIDSGYRGELGVVLKNSSDTDFHIEEKDRIAQLVIQEYISVVTEEVTVDELTASERGNGGFGSTGQSHTSNP